MKVKELKELLDGLDPNSRVLLSSDEEGNSFGDVASDWGEHKYEGEDVVALYPSSYVDGFSVE